MRCGPAVPVNQYLMWEDGHLLDMAERDSRRIAEDALDEPHVRDRRISVRQLHALVEERDLDPATVADRFELDVADVYHALAYYHDNADEMRALEAERDEAAGDISEAIDRPDGVRPDA
jgi:uncharacterized protein (DUF433 family)